jgi:hypothetical protein
MSAFMVDDITINRVVSWMYYEIVGDKNLSYYLKEEFKEYDFIKDSGFEKLANDMFQLNANSVEQRHGKGELGKFRSLDFEFKLISILWLNNEYQVLKSLRCWLYQCAEGDILDTNKLYQKFDRLSGKLAYRLVEQLDVYENAHWA